MLRLPNVALRGAPRLNSTSFANFSSLSAFTEEFTKATSNVASNVSFQESAEILRSLTRTNLLKATDLRDDPPKFFEAHRILARHSLDHGPGFWIRFTVHYNLFGGTVLAVGSDEQVDMLADIQAKGELGCFSLTEKEAGVQSGLVVNTTVDWDKEKQKFILNTPNVGARKNWISQGFVADKTVVLATLRVNGESKGPHGFVMNFRENGQLVSGIEIDDMGHKTVGNDLDNAWIHFDNVELPADAMLSRYANVVDDEYKLFNDKLRPFDMIGQRLYTGRVAVAQGALEYRRQLFKRTKEYSDDKICPGNVTLSSIPQLSSLYEENLAQLKMLDELTSKTEKALTECLLENEPPSADLVDAIATCKIMCVEESIAMCHRLKQEVGSYALMGDSGFQNLDYLQCCKFAEGDSRILKLKLARDRLKTFAKDGGSVTDELEKKLLISIGTQMAADMKKGVDKMTAFNNEWRNIYSLADACMARIARDF
ncbi:hypothetical protein ScalyP_jg5603 [Parmales sp. scaly parma]|nr:hypothetical protein ScalyP_jg5603 [Parmales sp. scaly parma]